MNLTIFGTSRSRAFRVLWMSEELDLDYHHVPISSQSCAQDDTFLAINAAGTIPYIDDDGVVIAESLAINLHLAERSSRLWPSIPQGRALAIQWSFWAATTVEAPYTRWASAAKWRPEEHRDAQEISAAVADMVRPLGRLDMALAGSQWLVGDHFSVADLNVASVVPLLRLGESWVPAGVSDWLQRCCSRPAFKLAAMKP